MAISLYKSTQSNICMSMSNNGNQEQVPVGIPFSSAGMQQQRQQNIKNPSTQRFPQTNEFGQPLNRNPSMASIASMNYGQEYNLDEKSLQVHNNKGEQVQQEQVQQEQIQQGQQEQQEQQLQRVSLQKNQIDQDQILRMFRQQDEKKAKRQKQLTQIRKKNAADKQSANKHKRALATSSKRQSSQPNQQSSKRRQEQLPGLGKMQSIKDIKQQQMIQKTTHVSPLVIERVRQLVMQYKMQYRTSLFDQQWQKQRYRLKQQFFQQLCLGVQQIKQKAKPTISQAQTIQTIDQLKQSSPKLSYNFGVFKFCRNLVSQGDLQLFVHFHQKSKQFLSKDYKAQYKMFLANLKDPQNFELRRKVLTKQMDVEMIKLANQIEFFTQAKRQQINEKQRKLLKQFSADRQTVMLKPQFQQQKQQLLLSESVKYDSVALRQRKSSATDGNKTTQNFNCLNQSGKQKNPMPVTIASLISMNKYLDESTLAQLQELLSQQHLSKMRNRIDQDLRGQAKLRVLERFDHEVKML